MLRSINQVATGYVWHHNQCGTYWLVNSAVLPPGFFGGKCDIEVVVLIIWLLRYSLCWNIVQRTVVISCGPG
jgi:hypothetical protein